VGRFRWVAAAASVVTVAATNALTVPADDRLTVADRVLKLTRESRWKPVTSIPIGFTTHHPQGMVKIGNTFLVSSVEIQVRTKPLPQVVDGFDRDTGQGAGHLFKIDLQGNLIADLKLGEGTVYHPGGIDYDGKFVWVPVAEYRPNSRSIIYRVDPETMTATAVLRFQDHIGGIVHDIDDETLHGVSWGARRFYRWAIGRDGRVADATTAPEKLRSLNTSHYVDYQDCKYAGEHRMLCTGVTEMRSSADAAPFRLGGIELVSLKDGRPMHQVPVLLWTPGGLDMTHNPVWIEPSASGLRGYFMPEDDRSTLYIYDVDVK
jgi:hypothetical protein